MPHLQEERETIEKPWWKELTVMMTHVQSDVGMLHSPGDHWKDDCKGLGQWGSGGDRNCSHPEPCKHLEVELYSSNTNSAQ